MIAEITTSNNNPQKKVDIKQSSYNSPSNPPKQTTEWDDLPIELRARVGEKPAFINGQLVYKELLARDPLSNVAYFDAKNITHLTVPPEIEAERRYDRHAQEHHLSVSIHADLLRVKSLKAIGGLSPTQKNKGALRGVISGFSQQSRMRLLQFMASVRLSEHIVFITITYPDQFPIGEVDTWLGHFEAFRRRFERMYPAYRVIWRKELKARKSGVNTGKIAPHYHMLIFTDTPQDVLIETEHIKNRGLTIEKSVSAISKMIEAWTLQAWEEIVDSGDPEHVLHGAFAVACRNRRHAYKYISKYVAKTETDEYEVGRRWGRIGTFDTDASFICVISESEYLQLLRMARSWMRSRGNQYYKGLKGVGKGRSIFGLGDGLEHTNDKKNPLGTVFRMLYQASNLENVLSPVPETSLNYTL